MRKIWIKIDPWNKEFVTTALEGGADTLIIPEGYSKQVKALGKIQTVSKDGDLKPEDDVVEYTIKKGEDEDKVLKIATGKKVIIHCTDWTIIPLENLIAKGADMIVAVNNFQDAKTAFGVLEKGVNAVLYHASDLLELKKILSFAHENSETLKLDSAEIIEVLPLGMGDRVCVDTCTNMGKGEGMLVGNSSSAMFLVHAESIKNPYVAPRPFRVNAGAVHAYIRVPEGKTRYLSELSAGDQVMLTNYKGEVGTASVGRLKIEKRPLLLIKAMVADKEITTIVQNAETIRLTNSDGEPLSVVALKPGDKVLVAIEEGGRHFGYKIEETITEL